MADQSQRFPEGIARDVPVKIKDNYVPTDFLVIDMGDEQDPPIVIGRSFLNTTNAIICIRTSEIHFQFRTEKVRCYFNNPEQPKKNKMRGRLQRLQRKMNTKLTDVKNNEEEIKEKSPQLLSAQYSEPVTPERSASKKQVWRKKDQSIPLEEQSLPASSTDQSMATTYTPYE
jgi:small nuclear ribonucleoprotein (snRNP)-like protein